MRQLWQCCDSFSDVEVEGKTREKTDIGLMILFSRMNFDQCGKGGLQRLKLFILKEGGYWFTARAEKCSEERAAPHNALSQICKSQDNGMLESGVLSALSCVILQMISINDWSIIVGPPAHSLPNTQYCKYSMPT